MNTTQNQRPPFTSRVHRHNPGLEALEARIAPATVFGVSDDSALVKFDSSAPSLTLTTTITGLLDGDSIVGIDFRPATGELYALGIAFDEETSTPIAHLYTIDTTTSVATQVGGNITIPQSAGVTDVYTDSEWGFDFNPTVDRIRVVTEEGDNFRLNPDNGAIAGADTALSSTDITGVAYDRNGPFQTQTTLYGINEGSNQLVTQGGINSTPSPNLGAINNVGALGVDVFQASFDISHGGLALGLFTVGGTSGLYSINLATGAATSLGTVGNGTKTYVGMSVAPEYQIFSSTGADAASIQATVDSFRTVLGGNNGVGGNPATGRREINWDGVPDASAAPAFLPPNFFNVNSARGVVFSTPGTGFLVSMDDDGGADADPDQIEFSDFDPAYATSFQTFSSQRLFSPTGSTLTTIDFFLPGTTSPATVSSFGAVFTDVDDATGTTIEYFAPGGQSLGKFRAASLDNGLSFLGVNFTGGQRIAKVVIDSGNANLGTADGPGAADVVAMDDFVYGEPQVTKSWRWLGGESGSLNPGDGSWGLASNWFNEVSGVPNDGFPNGADHIAKFTTSFGLGLQDVTLPVAGITVGQFITSTTDGVTVFTDITNTGFVRFESVNGTPKINLPNTNTSVLQFVAPVELADSLSITNDSNGLLRFSQFIRESGGSFGVVRDGSGNGLTILEGGFDNTFTGAWIQETGALSMRKNGFVSIQELLVVGDGVGAAGTATASVTFPDQIGGRLQVNSDGLYDAANLDDSYGRIAIFGGIYTTGNGNTGFHVVGSIEMAGGTLHIGGAGTTLALNGRVTATSSILGSALIESAGGSFNLNGTEHVFDIADGAQQSDLRVTANMSGNTAPFDKIGDGLLELDGVNTYDGTTIVTEGILQLDGSVTIGVILVNGTLTGIGTVNGGISQAETGSGGVSPGDFDHGILTATGDLLITDTTLISIAIGGANPGNGAGFHDQIVAATASLDDATLSAFISDQFYVPAPGGEHVIINTTGGVTGAFNGLPEGSLLNINGYEFAITYHGGADEQDVSLIRVQPLIVEGDQDFDGQDDHLVIRRNSSEPWKLDFFLNNETFVPDSTLNAAFFGQIVFRGLTGNDILELQAFDGVFSVAKGFRFDGGSGSDLLVLDGGGGGSVFFTNHIYTPGPAPGKGRSELVDSTGAIQLVHFENIEPVIDLVEATKLTVVADNSDNTVNVTPGGPLPAGIFPDGGFGGTAVITIDSQESIQFGSKSVLEIRTLGGNDAITVNNRTTPAGLTSLILDTGDGNDTAVISRTTATQVFITGGDGNDTLDASGVTGKTTIFGGLGNDTITGGSGDDLLVGDGGSSGAYLVTSDNQFVAFDPHSPESIFYTDPVAITGLATDETILGIDVRPLDGTLVALGSSKSLYTIEPLTGAATLISAGGLVLPDGTYGIDFNPTVDRLRLVTNAGDNFRANPNDGTLLPPDVSLTFIVDPENLDPFEGEIPTVGAVAYTNNVDGASRTTLFGLDTERDILVRIGGADGALPSPNGGQTRTIGTLGLEAAGFDVLGVVDFDIEASTNEAYAILQVVSTLIADADPFTNLYKIDLETGRATEVSDFFTFAFGFGAITNSGFSFGVDLTGGNDVIRGGKGNDRLVGGEGNDDLDGGEGDDGIRAGEGNNLVAGGLGNDTVTAGTGNDIITSGAGNDVVTAGDGNNFVDAGADDDMVTTGIGADTILGGDGLDALTAGDGANRIDGGAGNDVITAGTGDDTVTGGLGFDSLNAGGGANTLIESHDADFTLTNSTLTIGADGDEVISGFQTAILTGGASGNTFAVGAFSGELKLTFGGGSDTLDFSASPAGVTIDLDLTGLAQTFSSGAAAVTLGDAPENFIGTEFNDLIYADALTVPRTIQGGAPETAPGLPGAPVPPGDKLSLDGRGQFVVVQKTDFNTGTIEIPGYSNVDFDNVEVLTVVNASSGGGFGGGGASAFSAPTYFPVGRGPESVATGDLNGDGFVDVVTANNVAGTISILLGRGDGTFQSALNIKSGGKQPIELHLADLDGDLDLDIVTSNRASSKVAVLKNDGLANFSEAVSFKAGVRPTEFALGDLDGDNALDLVVVNQTISRIAIMINDGTGAFGTATRVKSGGVGPSDVGIADFNADGTQDIVVINTSGRMGYFAGNGTGVFTAPTATFDVGRKPTAVAIADLNNDGSLDVVVNHVSLRFVSVLLGNGAVAGDQFNPQVRIATSAGNAPRAMIVQDFNGDGNVDLGLAAAGDGLFRVMLGIGNGLLNPAVTFLTGAPAPRFATSIALGDFNGDGAVDVVLTNRSSGDISVLLRNPTV